MSEHPISQPIPRLRWLIRGGAVGQLMDSMGILGGGSMRMLQQGISHSDGATQWIEWEDVPVVVQTEDGITLRDDTAAPPGKTQ